MGRIHPEDFKALTLDTEGSCLAWVSLRRSKSASSLPQLLRVSADIGVQRGHVILGSCLSKYANIPRFGLVRLWRCRQVAMYMPQVELIPLDPPEKTENLEEDALWIRRRFEALLRTLGEFEFM